MPGTLFVVATPIGNLEDLSARAIRILREVALIAAEDTRRTAHLLTRYGIQTPTTSLNQHNESGKGSAIIARLHSGESVALVSDAGTPTVSDPGEQLVRLAIEAGVRVESIPGASAPLALLAIAGLPTNTFTFLGFPPTKAEDRKQWIADLAREPRTVVFFESPHRLLGTLEAISVYFGDCHIVMGRELTKIHEEVYRGPVSRALEHFSSPIGEFVLALNLAEQQKDNTSEGLSEAQIVRAFEESRAERSTSKRRAIQDVARKLGLNPNRVYEVVEASKKSVE